VTGAPTSESPDTAATGLTRPQADEVVVLLAAMGIEASIDQQQDGAWQVAVGTLDAERARALVVEEYPQGFRTSAEEAARARPAPAGPSPHLWMNRSSWAVVVAALACVAWFVRMHLGAGELTRSRLLDLGVITWDQVWLGEWWRLASGVFVHFDGAHLISNLLTLLIVGPPLAYLLGPWRFLLIFVLTGIAGNVASHVLAPSASLKAGASGAIAGVLGALGGTSLDPGWGRRFKRWQILGALAAIYGLLVGAGPNSDHVAHLGGLLAGIALGRLLTPGPRG